MTLIFQSTVLLVLITLLFSLQFIKIDYPDLSDDKDVNEMTQEEMRAKVSEPSY